MSDQGRNEGELSLSVEEESAEGALSEASHGGSFDTAGDRPLAPGLYLVATPIGNLEDISLRALRTLRQADQIACEDTRQTQKLLNHFGIRNKTVSYHLHNEQGRAEELVTALQEGARIALVSDAGTPGIADPGEAVVRAAIAAGVPVFPVPGANAALSALVASGLPSERFLFEGFLPAKSGGRRTRLEDLRGSMRAQPADESKATLLLYEAPHRILDTLLDVAAIFGPDHPVVIAREVTKLHEEFLRGTAATVREALINRPVVRGEIVLLLGGDAAAAPKDASSTGRSLTDEVQTAMLGGLSEKDALKQVAKARGLGKSEAYREWQRRETRRR